MFVRIRFPEEVKGTGSYRKHAPFASGLGGLITLVAVSCLMLALWRLTSDLGWTDQFVISEGILSHWQVWMALTIAFGALAVRLVRLGHAADLESTDASDAADESAVPGKAASR